MYYGNKDINCNSVWEYSLLNDNDIHLFKNGLHCKLYEKMGSHAIIVDNTPGTYFAVWAPNANQVHVCGNFNDWKKKAHILNRRNDESGIWEGFVPFIGSGTMYKYYIVTDNKDGFYKVDPFTYRWNNVSFLSENISSLMWNINYKWTDQEWMQKRFKHNDLSSPISIYEVHLGSWKQNLNGSFLNYRDIAEDLASYIKKLGFTHIELLPIMEHPFYGSWGYQTVGYFAPTNRLGSPQDFMFFVEKLHENGIGVLLDWVPSHFPIDAYGLSLFDGAPLFEYEDPRKGLHPDWNSYIFDYGKPEVRSFLISSAIFWLDKYHIDGLRVDGVASMLYLDYSRGSNDWIPNEHGGKENLDAIHFIRNLNKTAYSLFPDILMIAEESTAWPMVTKATYLGGLGFGLKWNMGWMHDTIEYLSKDPIFRKYYHNDITFSIWYFFSENYILVLSHDEVVYGKRSLLEKMPGTILHKFANLKILLSYMYAHPGKKLLFMGSEIAQINEWDHDKSLEWDLLKSSYHQGIHRLLCDLNFVYKNEPSLYNLELHQNGFEWIDCNDWEQSIICFLRKGNNNDDLILVICNFTPLMRLNYRVGVPRNGFWREILNTDAKEYEGSGSGNFGGLFSETVPFHNRAYSLSLTLPPLSVLYLKNTQ